MQRVLELTLVIWMQCEDTVIDWWPVPSEISQNEQKQFFFSFGVKNINLTNFKHNGFATIFFICLGFFISKCFEFKKKIYCAFVLHPTTLRLSSNFKNISNIMKFIKKIQENKMSKILEVLTVIDSFGPYNQAST